MWKFIVDDLVAPLVRRAGTSLGMVAIGYGATAEQGDLLAASAVAIGGVLVDLVLSKANRLKITGGR